MPCTATFDQNSGLRPRRSSSFHQRRPLVLVEDPVDQAGVDQHQRGLQQVQRMASKAASTAGPRPRHGRDAELLSAAAFAWGDDAVHPPGRFDLLGRAAGQHRPALAVLGQRARAHCAASQQIIVLIGAGEHPEPEVVTDLPAVLLDRPAGEVVASQFGRVA